MATDTKRRRSDSPSAKRQRRYRANLKKHDCSLVERLIDANRLDARDASNPAAIGRATSRLLRDWAIDVGRNERDRVPRVTDDDDED